MRYLLTVNGKPLATGPLYMVAPYLAKNPLATIRKVEV